MTLFVFAGLSGAGKTTLSRELARARGAAYLRIDTIERALRDVGDTPTGPQGYVVAYRVAIDNLRLGLDVVADSVNPLPVTRAAWRDAAAQAAARVVEIEVVCSDAAEHRRRVEARPPEVAGDHPLTWAEVVGRAYAPCETPTLRVDTAGQTPRQSFAALERILADHKTDALF